MIDLKGFQKRFLRRAFAEGVDTSCLSIPRGNGKSGLASYILARCLTPGDLLHQPGKEYLLGAASIEQARLCYRPIREWLEPTGEYRFIDSVTRLGITHVPSNTKLRVISSNAKTAMGIVGVPLMVCDEPGAWEVNGGELMYDAITTAMGKPESPLRVIFIGTIAPARGGWWPDLIADGTRPGVYVQALQGKAERWDQWQEIRRCNPLMALYPASRAKLLEERDAARGDSRLRARFMSYRLNVPTADEATMLLTVDDWELVTAREVPAREGQPVVAVDLAGGRAWSAAVAIWKSGRVEALAVAPGIPDLAAQEARDRVPKGTYQRLHQQGSLTVADGLRVQPASMLVNRVMHEWGRPLVVMCDRFRLDELKDAAPSGLRIEDRVTRYSEAADDIRAVRKIAKDGPMAVSCDSQGLLAASLASSLVQTTMREITS